MIAKNRASESVWANPVEIPKGATGVMVLYPPSWSNIRGAKPLVDGAFLPNVEVQVDNLSVFAKWNADTDAAIPSHINLSIEFSGAPPHSPLVLWESVDFQKGEVHESDFMEAIIVKRRELANSDRGHRLFFGIDKQTNKSYIPFLNSMAEEEKAFRLSFLPDLYELLRRRIELRVAGHGVAMIDQRHWVSYVSSLFVASARAYDGDLKAVAKAFEDFACGNLRARVAVNVKERESHVLVTEPDSVAIFMFAELAIASIDHNIDRSFWRPLLASLVKMQSYYLARWGERAQCRSHPHLAILEQEVRQKIDRSLRSVVSEVSAIEAMCRNLERVPQGCFW